MNNQSTTSIAGRFATLLTNCLLLITLGWAQCVGADPQHNLLFFLSLEGHDKFSSSPSELDDVDGHAAADVLYTYNNDRFSFLSEYLLSNTESELERFQASWQVNDKTVFRLGRFHSIAKLWTTEFHHGQFLQTSISRPGLEAWEDDSGPTSSHITGAAVEHEFERSDHSVLGISFETGLSAKFKGEELEPFDILDSESAHDLALAYRMTYRPDVLSTNQIGVALSWNDISVGSESSADLTDLRSIRQTTISLFADWSWADWRLLTNWVYFNNEMRYIDENPDDKFGSAYVQGEYKISGNWTLFGRSEFSFSEDDSRYLSLLPEYVAHRHMLGARWDFSDAQSLTLETARTKTQGGTRMHGRFYVLRLQWSAVFP